MKIKNIVAVPLALILSMVAYVVIFAQELIYSSIGDTGSRVAHADTNTCTTDVARGEQRSDNDHMLFISCGGFLE